VQVPEAVQDIADAANNVAEPFLLLVDLTPQRRFQFASLLVEAVDLGEVVSMLIAALARVTGMLLPLLPE
jgi:hypothetical protein